MRDILEMDNVEIVIDDTGKLWINTEEGCILRIGKCKNVDFDVYKEPEPSDEEMTTVNVDWSFLCAVDELLMSDQAFGCFPASYHKRKDYISSWEGNKVCTTLRAFTGDDYEVRKEGSKAYYEDQK